VAVKHKENFTFSVRFEVLHAGKQDAFITLILKSIAMLQMFSVLEI
jgi:hypothetical protein